MLDWAEEQDPNTTAGGARGLTEGLVEYERDVPANEVFADKMSTQMNTAGRFRNRCARSTIMQAPNEGTSVGRMAFGPSCGFLVETVPWWTEAVKTKQEPSQTNHNLSGVMFYRTDGTKVELVRNLVHQFVNQGKVLSKD